MSRVRVSILGLALVLASGVFDSTDAALAANSDLSQRVTSAGDGWSRYQVELQPAVASPCCYTTDSSGEPRRRGCNLDNSKSSITLSNKAADSGALRLDVYLKSKSGRVVDVRALGSDCPVANNDPVKALLDVPAADSVALLRSLVDLTDGKSNLKDGSLSALAFHAGENATNALIAIADSATSGSTQHTALFWLGQTRGEPGAQKLDAVIRSDASLATRKHAIFSLSQSKVDWKSERLRQLAREQKNPTLRAEAWFWLAQTEGAKVRADLLAALARETDERAIEHMVFALSQTGEGADAALIQLVEGNASSPVKKRAMFWLGQSGSDLALNFFDRVLSDQAKH